MRENYVLGREFWVEGGPVMKLSFDEELTGPHGPMAVRFYYPTDERLLARKLKVQPLRLSSTCTEAASFSATLTLMIASAASSPAIQARSSWQSITASPLKRNSLQPWRGRLRCAVLARRRSSLWHRYRAHGVRRRFRWCASEPGRNLLSARHHRFDRSYQVPAALLRLVRPYRFGSMRLARWPLGWPCRR